MCVGQRTIQLLRDWLLVIQDEVRGKVELAQVLRY